MGGFIPKNTPPVQKGVPGGMSDTVSIDVSLSEGKEWRRGNGGRSRRSSLQCGREDGTPWCASPTDAMVNRRLRRGAADDTMAASTGSCDGTVMSRRRVAGVKTPNMEQNHKKHP